MDLQLPTPDPTPSPSIATTDEGSHAIVITTLRSGRAPHISTYPEGNCPPAQPSKPTTIHITMSMGCQRQVDILPPSDSQTRGYKIIVNQPAEEHKPHDPSSTPTLESWQSFGSLRSLVWPETNGMPDSSSRSSKIGWPSSGHYLRPRYQHKTLRVRQSLHEQIWTYKPCKKGYKITVRLFTKWDRVKMVHAMIVGRLISIPACLVVFCVALISLLLMVVGFGYVDAMLMEGLVGLADWMDAKFRDTYGVSMKEMEEEGWSSIKNG